MLRRYLTPLIACLQPGFLRVADRIARSTGIGEGMLDGATLISHAERRAQRRFRDAGFADALDVLLRAHDSEAELSLVGRLAMRWDVQRFLANLLRFEAEEAEMPQILEEKIEKPIFITGLPRSGTTFLHSLMAQDSANRVPLCWQTIYPYPLARDAHRDTRDKRVDRQFKAFENLSPGISSLHPLTATTPQECTEITAHVFQSLRFDTTHYIPSYQGWLDAHGHVPAFRFHKRFLQHMQHQNGPGQWVLKCPDHVFCLDAIKTVYPDARFVFVHRDPLSVLPSVAKLTELIRAPFTRNLDPHAIGREVSTRWEQGASLILAAPQKLTSGPGIFHIHYKELTREPLASVAAIYAHFGIVLSAHARDSVGNFIRLKPRGGYGVNSYSFEQSGLDPEALRERFGQYMASFGIESEVTTRTTLRSASALTAA